MAEPTLTLKKSDLYAEVAFFLGFGRGPDFGEQQWTREQQSTITSIANSGYRQFLYPAMGGNLAAIWDWCFLHPTATFTLPTGQREIPLPDDFGGFDGPMTVLTGNVNSWPWRIDWRNEGTLRELFQSTPTFSGPPVYAATSVQKATTYAQSQRTHLLIFPQADQNYTLQCPYFINPDALTDAFPYCLGGAQHTETILAAVIAAAELYLDDARGPRFEYFQERLQASVAADRKNKPQGFGPNLDRSDGMDLRWGRTPIHGYGLPTLYNGGSVQP